MKKTFKILILFIFLFLICLEVEASEPYLKEWYDIYYLDNGGYFDVIDELENGNISLGYGYGYNDARKYVSMGSIVKYDDSGERIWEVKEDNYYHLRGAKLEDGFVVLSQYYEKNNADAVAYIALLKYDFDGNKIWETKIEDGEINSDFLSFVSLECANDIITIGYNSSFFIFDISGEMIKDLSSDKFILPVIDMDDECFYVAYLNNNFNTVIDKYAYDSYEKIDSVVVYEGTVSDSGVDDLLLIFELECIKENIIISTYGMSGVSELSIYDNKFDLLKKEEVSSIVIELKEEKNGFITIGEHYENDARGIDEVLLNSINELTNTSFDLNDVNSMESSVFYDINKYDNDVKLEWTIQINEFEPTGIGFCDDGFVVVGAKEGYSGSDVIIKYIPSIFEEKNEIEYDFGSYEEYFYDVVEYNKGMVAVGEYFEYYLVSPQSAKSSSSDSIGIIARYDENGKTLWIKTTNDISKIYFKLVEVSDGFIVLGHDSFNQKLFLIKYDFDGNVIWEKDIIDYIGNSSFSSYDEITLDSHGDLLGIVCDGVLYFYDISGELVRSFDDEYYYNVLFNEFGIFLTYKTDEGDLYISHYDYKFNLVKEILICEDSYQNFEKMSYNDEKIYILLNYREVLIYNINLEQLSTLEMEYSAYDFVATSTGFITVNEVSCANGLFGDCGDKYIIEYDLKNNKTKKYEISYVAYSVDYDDGIVVSAGYSEEYLGNGNYNYFATVGKYEYPKYNVSVSTDGNGNITSSVIETSSGSEVEFTIEPKAGYSLKKVMVMTSSGEILEFSDYKFTMPSEDVEIYAEFELIQNPNTGLNNPFIILGGIIGIALLGTLVVKKKKFI